MLHRAPTNVAKTYKSSAQRRADELCRLLPLWPKEARDCSLPGRQKIGALIERALRHERQRARSGHWAYDVARHSALYRVWQREKAELDRLQRRQNISAFRDRQTKRAPHP